MNKYLKIIISNILVFLLLFAVFEVIMYIIAYEDAGRWGDKMKYSFINPVVLPSGFDEMGRDIENLPSKKQPPIVIFGCSYAFGLYLEDNQTFAYKLSKLMDRDVINRAMGGGTLTHMLYQTENPKFYQKIPFAKDVIYIMMCDTAQRLYLDFSICSQARFNMIYHLKNGKLVFEKYDNPFANFIKSTYTYKWLQHVYIDRYLKDEKNANEITDFEMMFFNQARENLEKHWKTKVNFTVISYDNINKYSQPLFEKMILEKLSKNGFNVINLYDETTEDFTEGKYIIEGDGHPTEAAWDLLTPIIVNKLPK